MLTTLTDTGGPTLTFDGSDSYMENYDKTDTTLTLIIQAPDIINSDIDH